MTNYTIFGAGPAGLYAAWRLLTGTAGQGGQPLTKPGDTVELVEWGNYSFTTGDGGSRLPAGRICSHHFQNDASNSYIEVGGMRFLEWDKDTGEGHQLVTKTIGKLGLDDQVQNFLTTDDPLFYLRGEHFYQKQLPQNDPPPTPPTVPATAPYNTPGVNEAPADAEFGQISNLMQGNTELKTRAQQCAFYATGTLPDSTSSVVYNAGDLVSNIGYWNFFYDQAGNEGYQYAADAGGYSSNVINWNAANAAVYNGEFAPGGAFKTLKCGYSQLFVQLFAAAQQAAVDAGVTLTLTQQTRLHSIWLEGDTITYATATAADPDKADGAPQTTDAAFLAMPRHSIELVARATKYQDMTGKSDFLNTTRVQNYVEAVIEQPSYKIAMFFDSAWWKDAPFPPDLVSSYNTNNGLPIHESVFGPTITDLPLRQVYYFGNNAPVPSGQEVYGILASYDDMRFTQFWKELEVSVADRRTSPQSESVQPLDGAATATEQMVQMLRLELAKVHFGDPDLAWSIPKPLETVFMDWGERPFGAGYHAWAAHYDIVDVMQKIRTPATLAGASDAPVFVVGSAYSNDQAWVEGAFNTVESVLTEYFDADTIADTTVAYPFICGGGQVAGSD